jgi:ornithine cyclodeaminase
MPSLAAGAPGTSLAVKAITVMPGNHGTRYDSHQGAVLLFEGEHGSLQAVFDASAVTAIRTAAVSGVATRALAREDAGDLAILGTGVQADTHLEAMLAARPLRRIRAWSRGAEHVRAFAERAARRHDVRVEPAPSARDAVEGADLVCTVTASREPVVEAGWIAAGAHVNAVGASVKTARELDSDTVARARLFVDRRESALAEAGDFLIPRGEGRIPEAHILAELGEVLLGRHPGRRSRDEVTVFKSLGLAVEDLAAARLAHARALASGAGTWVELGGERPPSP